MVREGGGAGRCGAQYNLGVMYYNGQGVDVNYKRRSVVREGGGAGDAGLS